MKTGLHKRVSRLETSVEEAHIQALRQTIAELEQRKVELLADLTTLEEAIAAMRIRLRPRYRVEAQQKGPE